MRRFYLLRGAADRCPEGARQAKVRTVGRHDVYVVHCARRGRRHYGYARVTESNGPGVSKVDTLSWAKGEATELAAEAPAEQAKLTGPAGRGAGSGSR